MAIELTLSIGGPVEFRPGLPPDYTGPLIPGSVAAHAKTNIAQLAIQELTGDQYSIRFILGRILSKITGIGKLHKAGLYSHLMLKNSIRKEIESIGKFHLREGQYVCFYTEPSLCKASLDNTGDYKSLDIYFTPKLVEELVPFFPELKNMFQSGPSSQVDGQLAGRTFHASHLIREITHQLLNCHYDEATSRFYFDLKVREFLFEMMINTFRRNPTERHFTPWEVAKIHDARKILLDYIAQKPPSVRFLSKQVALNVFKLKTGFRQYFNAGIFEWLMDEKMQEAKNLLLNSNKPVKEISSLVGYTRTTNFITAFRRRFGITPGGLRRK